MLLRDELTTLLSKEFPNFLLLDCLQIDSQVYLTNISGCYISWFASGSVHRFGPNSEQLAKPDFHVEGCFLEVYKVVASNHVISTEASSLIQLSNSLIYLLIMKMILNYLLFITLFLASTVMGQNFDFKTLSANGAKQLSGFIPVINQYQVQHFQSRSQIQIRIYN